MPRRYSDYPDFFYCNISARAGSIISVVSAIIFLFIIWEVLVGYHPAISRAHLSSSLKWIHSFPPLNQCSYKAFSFNQLYLNGLSFNSFYSAMEAYFNVRIFQFLMRQRSSLCNTTLFECLAGAIASLTLMRGGSTLGDTTLIECPARVIASLCLRASNSSIVSLNYIIK
jgi:hypothetical protein